MISSCCLQSPKKEDSNKDDDIDEDGFEALFKQLEEDLKRDEEFLDDGEDEISEEELAMLERELEEALAEDENMSALLSVMTNDAAEGKSWQLRRLAQALKVGRRKTSMNLEQKMLSENGDCSEQEICWSARKRLKKVQVETLENVYRRTKRPTNTMISSIAHVTNLPRRRILKWFEDKRADEGVPADPASAQQRPYRRSSSESVFTQ
uniref:Homeobox domain-containing protein n=1 Tax=Chenopodium quinoa TaxID=63459 RepID=A0A803MJQ9_CHEQI